MLSNSHIKIIQALKTKKQRQKKGLFIAEGEKIISEILASNIKVRTIFTTDTTLFEKYNLYPDQLIDVSDREMKELTSLNTPSNSLGIFQIPDIKFESSGLELFLDEIQDPGNLGTIIRIADWYGIHQIHCKKGTVDLYNPKVLQSSMGSFMRVQINTIEDCAQFFEKNTLPVYGTFINGEDLHKSETPEKAMIVIGNEGKGISDEITSYCKFRITIPKFGEAESLNAGVATAIILDNFKR